jgi:hypothetical protein
VGYFCNKNAQINNHPMGDFDEFSPNLVTLFAGITLFDTQNIKVLDNFENKLGE